LSLRSLGTGRALSAEFTRGAARSPLAAPSPGAPRGSTGTRDALGSPRTGISPRPAFTARTSWTSLAVSHCSMPALALPMLPFGSCPGMAVSGHQSDAPHRKPQCQQACDGRSPHANTVRFSRVARQRKHPFLLVNGCLPERSERCRT